MTKKRFIGSSGGVYDQYKSDRFTWSEWEEILQIMNNLNEKARERSKALSKLQKENEQLKHDATVLIQSNQDYRKENEQLKQQNDFLTTQLAELSTYMVALGYDIELEFEGGRVIKLNEELKGDVE